MARKKIVPKADWLVGSQRLKETTSQGGLIIPASAERQDEVVVIAVGPDVKRVKVGDVIIFGHGRSTNKEGDEVWLIQDEQILATIEDA
jgi:co-chaperonin GroES (HSP10)